LDALGAAADRARAELGGGPAVEPAVVELQRGAKVHVRDLGVDAEIVGGPDAEGKVQLRRGGWTIQSHVSRLAPVAPDAGGGARRGERVGAAPASGASWSVPDDALPLEVDLRGMDVVEALRAVDQGLDRGLLAGLTEVRIIHGLGKGVLKSAVDRHLRGHPQVASCRMGELREGGRGVTVAKLR
jgi:DNA mismatch repair protein MutS2